MFRKFKEKMSIHLSKNPGGVVLVVILLLNVVFITLSALAISALSVDGTEDMNFWVGAYRSIMMVLDAGCVEAVVEDVGTAGVALVVTCLVIVLIGMVLFTGAVIGYLTNWISGFIENANLGSHKVHMSGHTVILNWNTRASEIVNDLMYCETRQKVVILVQSGKESIQKELDERIADTVAQENAAVRAKAKDMPFFRRIFYVAKNKFKGDIVVLVREGDTFSTKQLRDISIERAKSIIILGSDINNTTCKYELQSRMNDYEKGNPQSIKALVQVAELTGAVDSDDDQKIIIEVENDWTLDLVNKIIASKQVHGKCNIIPVSVNRILGRLLSQFSLMPELNLVYKDLFSNKGMTFFSEPCKEADENAYVKAKLHSCTHAIPLTVMEQKEGRFAFYASEHEKDVQKTGHVGESAYKVFMNRQYWVEQKNVIILGHNSKIKDIMDGFNSFRDEWNYVQEGREIMNILVIDDKAHLEKMDYYKAYPYVRKTVEADIYDQELIFDTIEKFVDNNITDTSVLILSDDTVVNSDIDANAIANLIYVRDVINRKKASDPTFDEGKLDVVVEILNPKHYDIVKSYSVNNVVISNRYISKMVTQLGEKDTLFDFYMDILTYDEEGSDLESKEIYVKKVCRFFDATPAPCTVAELIRSVYEATSDPKLPKSERTYSLVLGYVKQGGEMQLFSGDQNKMELKLESTDKLIIFATH